MLRLIPGAQLNVIERCSGHGGSWGVMHENFETALKVGRPVARQALRQPQAFVASECPLAAMHILQGMEQLTKGEKVPEHALHPIELFARAYGLVGDTSQPEMRTADERRTQPQPAPADAG